jgi:hypothetical protein
VVPYHERDRDILGQTFENKAPCRDLDDNVIVMKFYDYSHAIEGFNL